MTKQLVFKHNMSTDSDSGRLEGNSGRREHSGRRKSEGYHSGRRIRPGLGGSAGGMAKWARRLEPASARMEPTGLEPASAELERPRQPTASLAREKKI